MNSDWLNISGKCSHNNLTAILLDETMCSDGRYSITTTTPVRLIERQKYRIIDRLNDRMTDWSDDRMTNRLKDRMTDRLKDRMTDRLKDRMTDRLNDRMTDRLKDWMTDRLKDRMTDPLKDRMTDRLKDRMTDRLKDRMTIQRTIEWPTEWKTEWLIDWKTKWLIDWTTEWSNDWMAEWLNTVEMTWCCRWIGKPGCVVHLLNLLRYNQVHIWCLVNLRSRRFKTFEHYRSTCQAFVCWEWKFKDFDCVNVMINAGKTESEGREVVIDSIRKWRHDSKRCSV